jgi:transcription antitermination protein NusB
MTATDSEGIAKPAPPPRSASRRPADGTARSARRRAREFALQALYGWQMTGGEGAPIAERFKDAPGYGQADEAYFLELLNGTIGAAEALRSQFASAIDRRIEELSPVEHSILMIATYELAHRPEIPYRVVINEAVELAKSFGASEGYRYVNGVLDKLAGRIRPAEASSSPGAR